jgi:hypothetical protein
LMISNMEVDILISGRRKSVAPIWKSKGSLSQQRPFDIKWIFRLSILFPITNNSIL